MATRSAVRPSAAPPAPPAPAPSTASAPASEAEIMVPVPDEGGGGAPEEPVVAGGRGNDDILPEASPAGIRTQAKAQRSAWSDAIRRVRGQ